METWNESLFLMRKEWRNDRRYFLLNILLMIYLAGCIALFLADKGEGEARHTTRAVVDTLFLAVVPMMGFFASKRSMRCMQDNSYTQMLLYYKTLPIPFKSVVTSRVLQALSALIINGILFYGVFYLAAKGLNYPINGWGYMAFALTWTGFALLMTGPYMYFEFLHSGRVYMGMCLVHGILSILAAVVIAYSKGNLFNYVVDISKREALLSPLMWGSLIVGICSLLVFSRIVLKRLEVRDLV